VAAVKLSGNDIQATCTQVPRCAV